MRVIVSGSSGLIGSALVASLRADGHEVTRLVRRPADRPGEAAWNPAAGTIDAPALEGHDAVVHLAGAGIGDRRWTPEYKAELVDSRVKGTTLLARTLAGLDRPPSVLASGSAIGYYGDRGDEVLTEDSAPGSGFLADLVARWEASTGPAEQAGIRVAHLRTGLVLSTAGGTLKKLLLPFRLGIGGRFGSGRQWMSWIAIDDEIGAIRHVLTTDDVRGAVNLVAPGAVRNADLAAALGRAVHRPAVLPTPGLALKTVLGSELAAEITAGQRVRPTVLERTGYHFAYPGLDEALAHELARR